MTEISDQLERTLRAAGQSLTKPRLLVFEALQNSETQSMKQLVTACSGVDRASVYRTITLFERLGIVQRLQIGWKYRLELSDVFTHHHHHMSCVQCGRLIPLPEDHELEERLLQLAAAQDFLPQDHQIEVRGLCADCQAVTA
jgi:Fe2+ or Zn2+ uptake regulation protein